MQAMPHTGHPHFRGDADDRYEGPARPTGPRPHYIRAHRGGRTLQSCPVGRAFHSRPRNSSLCRDLRFHNVNAAHVPDCLRDFPLESLDMYVANMKFLCRPPVAIAKLHRLLDDTALGGALRELVLDGWNCEAVPDCLRGLRRLRLLSLQCWFELSALPGWLAEVPLEVLSVVNTNVGALPRSFSKCASSPSPTRLPAPPLCQTRTIHQGYMPPPPRLRPFSSLATASFLPPRSFSSDIPPPPIRRDPSGLPPHGHGSGIVSSSAVRGGLSYTQGNPPPLPPGLPIQCMGLPPPPLAHFVPCVRSCFPRICACSLFDPHILITGCRLGSLCLCFCFEALLLRLWVYKDKSNVYWFLFGGGGGVGTCCGSG